jgi:gamma-D-glutamyl-L-lysine dipeptidyl-peptidase
MQRHRIPLFTLCLALALLVGVSAADRQAVKTPDEVLKPVKEKFAPDARLAVFELSTERQDAALVLKGEVDQPAARDAAVKALRDAGFTDIIDKVQVLPDPALGERTIGIVTVSVAHARTKPSHAAELTTEALMGSRVRLLKRQGGWYYAQTETERYLGWIEPDHVAVVTKADADAWTSSGLVMTTARFALVREQPDANAQPVCDLLVGDVLKSNGRENGWVAVELPDGRKGFTEERHVEDYVSWRHSRRPTPDTIEAVAKSFLGVPYLWGGTSAYGFDCSGFVKIVYKLNGIELSRDADQQALEGEAVPTSDDLAQLRKGDLLCFKARPDGRDAITHIGIYLGGKQFIHCAGKVKRNSFDPASPIYSENLLKRLVTVRRILT